MSHSPKDILDTMLERLSTMAKTDTVVGDPVTVGNLTIMPVIKLSVGFAAGGGEGKKETGKNGIGAGSGGGGGASVTPVGFITYDGDTVKFVGVQKGGKYDTLLESVPGLVKKISKKFGLESDAKKENKDKDAEDDIDKAMNADSEKKKGNKTGDSEDVEVDSDQKSNDNLADK